MFPGTPFFVIRALCGEPGIGNESTEGVGRAEGRHCFFFECECGRVCVPATRVLTSLQGHAAGSIDTGSRLTFVSVGASPTAMPIPPSPSCRSSN